MKVKISSESKKFLSDKMFGLFFEDINYGADGGLYAEMIENRQFSFRRSWAGSTVNDYHTEYVPGYGWNKFSKDETSELDFIEGDALSEKNPHYLKFSVTDTSASFTNKAYDGVCLKSGAVYNLTLWIRNPDFSGSITLTCLSNDRTVKAAEKEIKILPSDAWQKIEVKVTANSTIKNGLFVLTQSKGTVDYGYISLMPSDAVAGVFRKDLFELIKNTRPGFLRFPGGCIVEGAVLSNRYNWKDTVGKPWERRWNWNRWSTHNIYMWTPGKLAKFYPYYNQSYGIGFYEYFLLSELMGAQALPVLSVGIACQFQTSEMVKIDSPEFEEYIQSALDLIEFANGDASTKWGSLRAEMGHKNSFNLKFIGIGNEQWETDKVDFLARYDRFEKAIHAKYPDIELIGTAGPDVTSEKYTTAWNFFKEKNKTNKKFTAAIDEHYYMSPQWFYDHIHMYDSYSREVPVFAGEYAAHTEHRENNLEAALAEAAFMTGLEKNADVIRFASVAPLFSRLNYTQWWPDFIWFDGDTSMGTPGYYVQKMFGKYTGTSYVEHSIENAGDKIFTSVTSDKKYYYVKVVNSGDKETSLDSLSFNNKELYLPSAKVYQIKGTSPDDKNSLGKKETVTLEKVKPAKTIAIPPLSATVIVIRKKPETASAICTTVTAALLLAIPTFSIYLVFSFLSDLKSPFLLFAIFAMISVLLGFIVYGVSNKRFFKKTIISLITGILLSFGIIIGEFYTKITYPAKIRIKEYYISKHDYLPFQNSKLLSHLDKESTLKFSIDEELPKLDGATALIPVYCSFVECVYPEQIDPAEFVFERSTSYAYESLMNGETDIIFAAGPSQDQFDTAKELGIELNLTPIGKEAFVFIVNDKNPISDISFKQIRDIYTGKITNWKELGWKNKPIRPFQREKNSGSQTAFEKAMGKDIELIPPETRKVSSMEGLIDIVSDYENHDNAIGYSFRYYVKNMQADKKVKILKLNGIEASVENIKNGTYPISDNFYAITVKGRETENTRRFIDWILSDQGQEIVLKVGYCPIK